MDVSHSWNPTSGGQIVFDHLSVDGSIIFKSELNFWSNKLQQPRSGVHKQQIVLTWHCLSIFDKFCSSFALMDKSSQPFHQMPGLGFNLLILQHKTFTSICHRGPCNNLLCIRKAPMQWCTMVVNTPNRRSANHQLRASVQSQPVRRADTNFRLQDALHHKLMPWPPETITGCRTSSSGRLVMNREPGA